MKRKLNPKLIDKENPEWTEEDFQQARPASEVLPELLGPQAVEATRAAKGCCNENTCQYPTRRRGAGGLQSNGSWLANTRQQSTTGMAKGTGQIAECLNLR